MLSNSLLVYLILVLAAVARADFGDVFDSLENAVQEEFNSTEDTLFDVQQVSQEANSSSQSLLNSGLTYAPVYGSCPDFKKPLVRPADDICDEEKAWLKLRHAKTDPALRDYLRYTAKFTEAEIAASIPENETINIGLAPSGGSFRAMFVGAGQLAALDNRTAGAFEHGLGGVLQATTYLAGLSGSGWLVGSLAMNDFHSVDEILATKEIWNLKHPFYNLGGIKMKDTYREWVKIRNEVHEKKDAGFNITMTDPYQRALARQLFPQRDNYLINLSWSDLRTREPFSAGDMPLPIMQGNGKPNDQPITYENSTVFEFNPFEFGTWDPAGKSFMNMRYLGTNVSNGKPVDGKCVTKYDNAGFLVGVTSSLFDMMMDEAMNAVRNVRPVHAALRKLFSPIIKKRDHVAIVEPNPFRHDVITAESLPLNKNSLLFLVDGGEDQQKIPLIPLVQPQRKVDVIFSYDLGAETSGFWPSGSSLSNSYERQFTPLGAGWSIPYVPDDQTFRALNYTHRPAFFGCDAKNLTSLSHIPPIIVYTANSKYSYSSNAPTYKTSFSEKEKRGHISNGFATATRGNLTDDSEYATCVGCAIVRRSQERLGVEQSEQCKQCFQRYCWNGEIVHLPEKKKFWSRVGDKLKFW